MKIDKLLNSRWFVKIIAFLLAFMLHTVVNMDTTTSPPQSPSILPSATEDYEALSNVPLVAYYDQEKYSITNLPQEVTVFLQGSSSAITTTKMHQDYEVYIDMQQLEAGEHRVKVQHKGFSNRLQVKIEPTTVTVVIQEKIAKELPVEVDFLNQDLIMEGYTAEQPIVLPNKVKVIGAKDQVERVSFVKGLIDLKGANETVEMTIPLKVYDQNGEVINLDIEPSVVEVKVPIVAPSKTVPVVINRTGDLPLGLSIKSFEAVPNEVTIFGPKEIIKQIEYIDQITFDLTTVKEDTTKEVELSIPEGVKKINPNTVSIDVDVEPEENTLLTNIPIKIIGLSEDLEVSFISPSLGVVDLNVFGSPSNLETLNRSDLHVVLNLSEFIEGQHTVDLEVFGPSDLRWELNTQNAVIEIKEKE